MRKLIILIFLFYWTSKVSYGQFHYDIKNKNYYQIVEEADSYFQNQSILYGRSILEQEGSEYIEYLRWKDYWEPRLSPHGDFEKYLKAYETVVKSGGSRANSDIWTELGPFNNNGDDFTSNCGTQAGVGPIEFIEFNKQDPTRMICGSEYGGLFFTTDAGLHWFPAGSDSWYYSGCRTAVIHPANFTNWLAVSQFGGNKDKPILGFAGGIWETNTMGFSWEQIATPSDLNLDYYNQIYKILISPANPNKVMLATDDGIRYTDNVSATPIVWNTPASLVGKTIFDVEIRLNNPNHFIITERTGTTTAGTWKIKESFDGGITWSEIVSPVVVIPGGHLTLEVSEANPNMLYCMFDNTVPGVLGVCSDIISETSVLRKYNMSTASWLSADIVTGHVTFGWGHGFGVSQTNAQDLYFSYADRYKTYVGGVETLYNSSFLNKVQYHVDIEDFACHPTNNGEVWMANHGGVHRSTDFGQTWESRSNGLAVANVVQVSTSATHPDQVIIGAFHNANLLTTEVSAGTPWGLIYSGDGQYPMIDYDNNNNMWLSSGSGFAYSNDLGATYTGVSIQETWNKRAIQHPVVPSTIFAPAPLNVARSNNNGLGGYDMISNFATTLTPGAQVDLIYELEIAPSNPDYLYSHILEYFPADSSTLYRIYRTTDANNPTPTAIHSTWQAMTTPNLDRWIKGLSVDYEDPNILYVVYASDVSVTYLQDEGSEMVYKMDYSLPVSDPNHMKDITFNLPNVGINACVLEKGTDGGLYVATDVGVYFINNARIENGTYWYKLGELPHVLGSSLEINYAINKIRVGTFGRGVWEHDLFCPTQDYAVESGVYAADKFVEVLLGITSTATVNSGLEVDYRSAYAIELKPGFRANPGSDFNAFIHRCNAAGNSFKNVLDNSESTESESADKTAGDEVIHVYPNPSSGLVTIQVESFDEKNSNSQLIIYNSVGKIIRQIKVTGEKTDIDLSGNASGIYLLYFSDGKSTNVVRLSKVN